MLPVERLILNTHVQNYKNASHVWKTRHILKFDEKLLLDCTAGLKKIIIIIISFMYGRFGKVEGLLKSWLN